MPAKIPPMPVPNPPSKSLVELSSGLHEQLKAEAIAAGIPLKQMSELLMAEALKQLKAGILEVEAASPTISFKSKTAKP